jgi:hypothetical protein
MFIMFRKPDLMEFVLLIVFIFPFVCLFAFQFFTLRFLSPDYFYSSLAFLYKTGSRKYPLVWFKRLVLNVTFNNNSAISWRPVLVVEKAGVPEIHRPWASNWKTLSLPPASRVHFFCNLQSWARICALLVVDLYELLDNQTTQCIQPQEQYEIWKMK